MTLIRPENITFTARISEDELRERLAREVLEQVGGLGPDGKRAPGIGSSVRRGDGRAGGYTITISGPMPARLLLTPPQDSKQ